MTQQAKQSPFLQPSVDNEEDRPEAGAAKVETASQEQEKLPPEITRLLLAWSEGDQAALAELIPMVSSELRIMARRYLKREKSHHTLQPTALVHELFLRLHGRDTVNWKNRAHFFGSAAQTMRIILVDHARRQQRKKRGGVDEPIHLGWDLEKIPGAEPNLEILALHEALEKLERTDPRSAEVVKLRFFAGMKVDETAAALEISVATVKREWQFARLWLYRELKSR